MFIFLSKLSISNFYCALSTNLAIHPCRRRKKRLINNINKMSTSKVFRRMLNNTSYFRTILLKDALPCLSCTRHQRTMSSSTSDEDLVIVEKIQMQHWITTIGINRPEKRNCVNHATALRLEEAIRQFEEDDTSAAAVLYGKGGNFCAGYDLSEVASGGSMEHMTSDNFKADNSRGLGPMGPSRRFFKKPVIAAISGYAVAGGLELALMCDARIMEDTAVLGVFCRRFGVPLIDGGTVRLPHLIGLSRALDLIMTGRPVKAKEALEIGLCTGVVACGTVLGQGIQYANQIAKFPQECLNRDRMSAYHAMYNAASFEDAVKFEMENGMKVFENESMKGAAKFVDGIGRHGSFNLGNLPPSAYSLKKSKDKAHFEEEVKSKL